MKTFIPVNDENEQQIPDLFDRLVPYQVDYGSQRFHPHDCQVTPADLQVQIPATRIPPDHNSLKKTGEG
ncbi:MAG TPA: hypothetical protein DCF62_11425 [Porticoccaceae bacterium]|nr:hypothetical protein [Porticoccaceae bacterium]HCO58958.1 hypothetical protein [Porticoccaceae bacterium]